MAEPTPSSPTGARDRLGGIDDPSEGGKRKCALITGATGQDGSYLIELLLGKGYIVHGLKRRASSYNHARLEHILNNPSTKPVVERVVPTR